MNRAKNRATARLLLSCLSALGAAPLSSACSSQDTGEVTAALSTGRLTLPLTAQGASGATYRLRFASFELENLSTGDLFFETSESDPLAPTLLVDVPSGSYRVSLFDGWTLERDDGAIVEPVPATLVSPATQFTTVQANSLSSVLYTFETGEGTVSTGPGTLEIQIEVNETAPAARASLFETNTQAVGVLSLRQTLEMALVNAGRPLDPDLAYRSIIDSYTEGFNGTEPQASHCDDDVAEFGGPGLNGFPLQCGRLESQQIGALDDWFATAVVNRFDLAPADGANCGQQRIVFGNDNPLGNSRMLMILEAQIPNPDPACGVAACFEIANFWDSLSNVPDPVVRGTLLRDAFLFGGPIPGFAPFINADNLGPNGGQVRTNNFNDSPWTLREFQFEAGPSAVLRPAPVAESPNGELWNDNAPLVNGAFCRQEFINSVGGLLTNNLAAMSFSVPEECKDAESRNDFSQDYAFNLSNGSGAFVAQLDAALSGTGLNAFDIANRARFAGSCMGCHQEASGSFLGDGVSAPFQSDFVHVSEQSVEPCEGGSCFRISDTLRDNFLPHRQQVLTAAIAAGPACQPTPLALFAGPASPVLTLGGQVAGAHAH